MIDDDWQYPKYKYVKPEREGYKLRKVKRGLLYNRYVYSKPASDMKTKMMEDKHPNWVGKTLAVVLFPLSILMAGVPEAWRDTTRYLWDRKSGSHTSDQWWEDN